MVAYQHNDYATLNALLGISRASSLPIVLLPPSMLNLLHDRHEPGADVVKSALIRSFSRTLVKQIAYSDSAIAEGSCCVLINPDDRQLPLLETLLARRVKIAIFGSLGVRLGEHLGLAVAPLSQASDWDRVVIDAERPFDTSYGAIEYRPHPLCSRIRTPYRPLCRFDFTDEWNNDGYGRVRTDGSIWAINQQATPTTALPLAKVIDPKGEILCTYAALSNTANASILWINRPVGPVDSWEWTLVENFFSHYRCSELPCLPHLRAIPYGYRGAVTMRLDCDQAIASARPLFELYRDAGLPFSLAVVTGLPPESADMALLRDILAAGGAVVSHSVSHPVNWGVDYQEAQQQAQQSKDWLETHLPECAPVRYAVSPFHQNPPYAVQALAEVGYQGFVGGIIHNDPEYLLGRAGQVPFCDRSLVSHSQQCMLHGDCYHRYGNSATPYIESFYNHLQAGSLFGYLDHPFSAAYQYGWASEEERLMAHAALIQAIHSEEGLWLPNLVECLDFVWQRSHVQLTVHNETQLQVISPESSGVRPTLPTLAIEWRGEIIPVEPS